MAGEGPAGACWDSGPGFEARGKEPEPWGRAELCISSRSSLFTRVGQKDGKMRRELGERGWGGGCGQKSLLLCRAGPLSCSLAHSAKQKRPWVPLINLT